MFHVPEPTIYETHIPHNLYTMFLLRPNSNNYKTTTRAAGTKFEEAGVLYRKWYVARNKSE